ncbi:Peptidase family M28 [Sphingomonas sp. YR710]|uniref:M20/M25/M40 family metallo-hydrolase n=1 Tax=Sphingomonas sp. YR710 TaxID=1882773 RepID=UPI00088FB666|nr:M20/M25/M40 family metallo-hydrolase [Sphingomonas sp. YR710]SDC72447.1 Peptidase family M28 [Sphingomonas sp. YR710]
MVRVAAVAMALIGALLWAILAVTPPAPMPSDAPPDRFSAMRAMADVQAIGRRPHDAGSVEDQGVRAYLAGRLRTLGADVTEQAFPLPAKSIARLTRWSGQDQAGAVAHNVVGRLPGRDARLPAILLMAHHDTVWGSPGAADDSMGVATILETFRAITARGRPVRDVVVLFTDAEELGLDGAEAFFARNPLARRVGVVINLESRGAGGRANMFETGGGNGAMMRFYADRVARPAANSIAVLIYDLMPNSTDFTVAKQRGLAGFNIATLGRSAFYHSPLATPEAIDPASLQDMGEQALALAGALAFAPTLPARAPDAAFSDILGRYTIAYSPAFGWVPLLLSAGLILIALRWRPLTIASLAGGAAVTAALVLHSGLLLMVLNAVSKSRPANYYDRLAALPSLEFVAAIGLGASLAVAPLFRRREPRMIVLVPALVLLGLGLLLGASLPAISSLSLAAMAAAWCLPRVAPEGAATTGGALILLWVVGLMVQLTEPTAGPLLAAAILLASAAMVARTARPAAIGWVVTALAAAVGLGHLAAFAHFTFLAVGADRPEVFALYMLTGYPLLRPLLRDRASLHTAPLLMTAAIVLAMTVRLGPVARSVAVYSLADGDKTRE